jgi:DNA processing protein
MTKQGKLLPKKLKNVTPPVKGLWFCGDVGLLGSEKVVAIVGSRSMSQYGKQVLSSIVPQLIEQGYVTISGFMYGIDIEMHRLTIENGGKTIGVFGWGIEAPIIPENQNLYHKVLESGGLFLSELPPKQLGTLWTFPARNRIVVGLADLVIVVEAGMKSGSLNSCEWARKMGKPVYAIPGSIFSKVSEGCNWLIAEGLAKPLTLDFFTPKKYSKKVRIRRASHLLSNEESILLTHLRLAGPQSLNELARGLHEPVGELSAHLTKLLLLGEVSQVRGIWQLN